MLTNQKALGAILIFFIIGVAVYFTYTRFKSDISSVSPTSSPSPSPELDFVLTKSPTPQQAQQQEPPLFKNKRLSQFPGILKPDVIQTKKALIQTQKGLIQLKFYPEATMAASNFILLSANGFYDNLTFHRVEDWVVQGGDPLGDGTGGPGYQFPDESVTRAYVKGIVAMANAGPNTNGSQFFILKMDYPLDPKYTIFGIVLEGMDVVEKLVPGDVMQRVTIQDLP